MSLRPISKTGVSTRSGVPVWLVECPECNQRYRLAAWLDHLAKTRSCQACSELRQKLQSGIDWARRCIMEQQQ